jgi:hypothetical protein
MTNIGIFFMLLFLLVLTIGFFFWMKKRCIRLRLNKVLIF